MTTPTDAPRDGVEEELRRTQQLLNACLESPKDIIILSIDKNYQYLFLNHVHKAAMKSTYGKDVAVNMNLLDCITVKEDREKAKINYDRALLGESHSTVEEFGDAERLYFETFYNPIRDENGAVIGATAFARDITARIRAEEALRKSESFMRTALENLPLIFYLLDREGNFTLSAGAGLSGLGLEQNQVVGLSVFDIYKDHPNIIRAIRQSLAGEATDFESYVAGTSHLNICVPLSDGKGASDGVIGVALDITDRKQAELAVAAEREQLSVTLRSIGDGVITTDTDGNIVMMNRVAEALTGWNARDARGKPLPEVFSIINELTRRPCENPVEKVLRTGGIIELENHTLLVSKDGHEIVIADSGAPIRDSRSNVIGVVLVFRDMTEKQKLNESQQRAQRLESLGVLAGGIAHDFNNLLGGIFGYLDMAAETVMEGNPQHVPQYLTKAMEVFDRARALTQQLLTFSKGGDPIRKTMQIGPFLKKCVSFALSGSNVKCRYDIPDDLLTCDCDENQMGQVIDNIVINAKQAMFMGGSIVVSARIADKDQQPISTSSQFEKFVKISIQDHGVGIPKEMIPHIFDPFFSTKEFGHGLGLATVFSIVQRHDGWIDVESEPGKGTTFHVYIPASAKGLPDNAAAKQISYKGTGAILVMDDEDFMRELVGKMLVSMGHTVDHAKNGTEAARLFRNAVESGTPFVACILDLTIPGGLGGKETALQLRTIAPDAVLIAASGYSEDPVMSNPSRFGFTNRIVKPFRRNELAQLLASELSAANPNHRS